MRPIHALRDLAARQATLCGRLHPPPPRVEGISGADTGDLTPVPGLPEFAFMKVNPQEAASAAGREKVSGKMMQAMRRWPALSAVIAMIPDSHNNTTLLVTGPEDAVRRDKLAGVYGVMQRLASSPFVKTQSKKFPTQFAVVRPFDPAGKTQAIRLPGAQTPQSIALALAEGGKPNQTEQLRDLVESLPAGKRVALLIAGPSAAGKSTLVEEIQKLAGNRHVATFSGDMYFRDENDPRLPRTTAGTPFWDDPAAMHFDEMVSDIAKLIKTGRADIPIYDFTTSTRGRGKTHVELGADDILVIDSLHAANPRLIHNLENLGLPHRSIYLDSVSAQDRLVRRIVRDYQTRGRTPERTVRDWDETTFPGEVRFVRPTILDLDPARDLFYITRFPNDAGLSREQIDSTIARLAKTGDPPSYQAFKANR